VTKVKENPQLFRLFMLCFFLKFADVQTATLSTDNKRAFFPPLPPVFPSLLDENLAIKSKAK
jgi:hypothetical protein